MPRASRAAAHSARAGRQADRARQSGPHRGGRAHGAQPTGALAGADVAFDAFCRQAGIARCESLATLCETLKMFHTGGPLAGRRVLVMGASGGDMAMTADAARHLALDFAADPAERAPRGCARSCRSACTIANPFDFHTHIWFDCPRQRAMFSEVTARRLRCRRLHARLPARDQRGRFRLCRVPSRNLPRRCPARRAARCSSRSLPESLSAATREMCLAAASCRCRDSARRSRRSTSPARSARPGRGGAARWSCAARGSARPGAARPSASTRPRRRSPAFGVADSALAAGAGARRPRTAAAASASRS